MEKTITIQQAAAQILAEYKKPLKSKDLARLAQERKLVAPSAAKDPIQSLSQVIERNIRLDKGNNPRLMFVQTSEGRCIALPVWYEKKKEEKQEKKEVVHQKVEKVEISIPVDILNKVQLYQTSFKLPSVEAAIVQLTKKGLGATANDLIEKLKVELEGL